MSGDASPKWGVRMRLIGSEIAAHKTPYAAVNQGAFIRRGVLLQSKIPRKLPGDRSCRDFQTKISNVPLLLAPIDDASSTYSVVSSHGALGHVHPLEFANARKFCTR